MKLTNRKCETATREKDGASLLDKDLLDWAEYFLLGLKNQIEKIDSLRADLDYQTTKEFNHFSDGSVDGTDNTKALVGQLSDDTKLIVTTIQKLNTAISKAQYTDKMLDLKDKRIVF